MFTYIRNHNKKDPVLLLATKQHSESQTQEENLF